MTRSVIRLMAAVSAAVVVAAGAGAQPPAGVSTLTFSWETLAGPAGAVNLNGARLMTVRGGGWQSVTVAKGAAETLQAAAMQGQGPDAVRTAKVRGGYAIIIGDKQVLVVDTAMAAAMKSSREALAEQWAQRLRQAFAGPYLSLAVGSQVVPVGERRMLALRGRWDRVAVAAEQPYVQAAWDGPARQVSLYGAAVGATGVVIEAGAARLMLPVQVMKYAGRVVPTTEAVVTGRSAPEWVIKRAASTAVYYSIVPEPGAWAQIEQVESDKQAIAPGQGAEVRLVVSVQGDGYLPVRATPRVWVANQRIPQVEAKVLMVSNRPEKMPSLGVWYEGRIPFGHPARLLYHHVNATGASAELAVELMNISARPVRVQIIEASGGPTRDEIFAGHKAARDFLTRQFDDVGYVLSLPDGMSYTAFAAVLRPNDVISGLKEMRLLDGGELRVRVRLRPAMADLVTPVRAMPRDRPSAWVFSEPHKRLSATYRVGQHWAFVPVGDRQVLSASGRELLDGDYGVFYDVSFRAENPTSQPAEVELAVMPGGGVARAILLIQGRLYESRMLRYGESQRLYGLTVPPGATRDLAVRIMPQAGSNYPVRLVMRPKGVWD